MSLNIFHREKDIRNRFVEAIQKYNFKQVDIARDIHFHHSTLSQWIQGKIRGNIRLEEAIENWLNNLYSNMPKFAGTNLSRLQMLTAKSAHEKLNQNFDSNFGFDNLVPININIELEGKKYKDTFFWNLNEPYLTVESFARILVNDNQLSQNFELEIISQMKKQISSYKKFDKIEGEELLKVIKLDIRIGDMEYRDQIEWDVSNPENDPEEFAIKVCSDMGLGTEFILPIVHSIREQILDHQKSSMNERKHFFYGGNYYKAQAARKVVVDENNYLREVFSDVSEWQPEVKQITEEEIKKFEKKEERKNRYAQRKK